MSQELIRVSRSFTAIYKIHTLESEKEQWRKHIEELPIQAEELTFEQQEWLEFRMAGPFPKPYRQFAPIVIPYRWQEVERENTET